MGLGCVQANYTECAQREADRNVGVGFTRCIIACQCHDTCDDMYVMYNVVPWHSHTVEQLCEIRLVEGASDWFWSMNYKNTLRYDNYHQYIFTQWRNILPVLSNNYRPTYTDRFAKQCTDLLGMSVFSTAPNIARKTNHNTWNTAVKYPCWKWKPDTSPHLEITMICMSGTLLLTWIKLESQHGSINNYILYKVWHDITYPFPNFNRATVEVWEWMINFIPHFTTGCMITYPCWVKS